MKKLFKKTLKLLGSRLVYLFVGLSFAVAIIVVQAAIGSVAVTPGTKLTATSWNTMINDLNSLDGRVTTLEGAGGGSCYTKESIYWGWNLVECDPGAYMVGFKCEARHDSGCTMYMIKCCNIK